MPKFNLPSTFDYAPYYAPFVAKCNTHEAINKQLVQQGKTLVALLKNLSAAQLLYKYAADKWSIKDILQHIIDVERVFIYRAMCYARGDRRSILFLNEAQYADVAKAYKKPLSKLLKEYKATRAATVALYNNLATQDLKRDGIATFAPMTVNACFYIIAGHELHHVQIIQEQYLKAN
jgi:uncharacterized damage-inducible protein DinB